MIFVQSDYCNVLDVREEYIKRNQQRKKRQYDVISPKRVIRWKQTNIVPLIDPQLTSHASH